MTPVEWFALLMAVFKFPSELLAVAKLLQKTPQEKRQEIVDNTVKLADHLAAGGRPIWD